MNILYINEDNVGAGSSKALLNYANGMTSRGHNVSVIIKKGEGFFINELKKTKAKVYLCDFSLAYYPTSHNPIKWLFRILTMNARGYLLSRKISSVIKIDNIDIVHTNLGPLPFALFPCKKNNIPHVWHHREFFDKWNKGLHYFPSRNTFFKQINSKGNYNICITHTVMDYLGLKENQRNRIIYDGIIGKDDLDVPEATPKDKYFFYGGGFDENKSPDILIRAFIKFRNRHPDYKLKMAGIYNRENAYYKYCISLIQDSQMKGNIELLGYRRDIRNLMSHASAIVVTSIFEGFGFVLVEGMLNKTVVIGNNTTGTREQFDIGLKQTGKEIGLRFSNEDELVSQLTYVVENDTHSICQNAFSVVCKNYTIDRCVTETEEFYNHVLTHYNSNTYE